MPATLAITSLRCEYLENPLGIDEPRPRLSWRLESNRRGARQTAWRIRVAATPEALDAPGDAGLLWDSGRVENDRTTHIDYAGRPLASRDTCHWRVEAWDETGASALSAPACWTMGLLSPSDWQARWIAADPEIIRRDPAAIAPTLTEPGTPALFRREFTLDRPVRRATLHASARGLFEFHANGRPVTADLFAPEWTDYDKRIHYRTYDITALLAPGRNTLQALLGDGWWSGFVGWQETRARYGSLENSLLAQLEIELHGGTRLVLATDRSWRCATGPVLFSDLLMGETCDARREPRDWLPAREVPAPAAALVAQRSEPVRCTQEITPVSMRETAPGVFIYDLGQNIAGRVRLRLDSAPPGARIVLRHGERLNPDGTLYTENLRRAKAADTYIARGGGGAELYEPRFTFHGFQYVELTGFPGTPRLDTLIGRVIHSATPPAGAFECSHPGVNRLWLNAAWSQRGNFLSVPTDCPQRDERLGWTGDAQVFIRTATCNMNVAAFFTKWMTDIADAQTPDGIFPDTAPRLREGENFTGLDDLCGGAGWADAGIIVPWTLWRVYGDRRIIEKHWPAMTAWLDYLERTNPGHLRTRDLRNNYGDWLCIPTDTSFRTHSPMKNLLATAFWAGDAAKMARMARALGRAADARRFTIMFERVRAAFQREYILPDGRMAVETQTAWLLALAFDLMPPRLRERAAARLVENIRALDWHLSTGFIGVGLLNPVLTLAGRADVACRLLLQETHPSWLYPVLHGATTIWERWNGWTARTGFFEPSMNSFNHYSLGSVGEWLFRHVAGIELDPEIPGFSRFILRPFIAPGLDFARATHQTLHGEIKSHWRLERREGREGREGVRLHWEITVPPNTSAQVFIPADPGAPVGADGLALLGREGGFARCHAPAGAYTFTSAFDPARAAPAP
jgi:alpha-L-rhamnosidase